MLLQLLHQHTNTDFVLHTSKQKNKKPPKTDVRSDQTLKATEALHTHCFKQIFLHTKPMAKKEEKKELQNGESSKEN